MSYIPGQPYGLCDRCGFKRRLPQLRAEWTNLMVCDECYDPRPPELDPPHVYPEGLPWPNARPEPADVEIDDNDPVLPGDL